MQNMIFMNQIKLREVIRVNLGNVGVVITERGKMEVLYIKS